MDSPKALAIPLSVGIIGGLGPQATADLFRKIVEATPVTREQDHLHVIIDSQPKMPDRQEAICGAGPSAGPFLAAVAKNLELAGADFLILASNTPHFFASAIRRAVSIPFLDTIEETCDAVEACLPDARRIGILGAKGCIHASLYQTALLSRGIDPVVPESLEISDLMEAIAQVKLGTAGTPARERVLKVAQALRGRGAEGIVLACTELPLIVGPDELPVPGFDCTRILARAAVAAALGERPLPKSAGSHDEEDSGWR